MVRELEEKAIITALTEYLGHSPTIGDVKRCTRYYLPGDMLDYTLAYDGVPLYRVCHKFESLTWSITIKPCR